MKNILLIVFSGTGNTLRIAEMIQADFRESGCTADIYDISKPSGLHPGDYDIIGLGYPIYAFNAPKIFLDAVKKISLNNKPVFIFKTSGEYYQINNSSSYELKKIAGKNNLIGEYHFLMPYNIIFRFPDSLVKQMYIYAGDYSKILVSNILTNTKSFMDYNIFNVMFSFILRIQRLGAFLNSRLYRVDRSKCIDCMRCVKKCPAGNISFSNNTFRFSNKCQMCMRCCFYCPGDAIRPGFLNAWKVNGPFDFEKITNNNSIESTFINKDSKGFYKSFIRYFDNIDALKKGKTNGMT